MSKPIHPIRSIAWAIVYRTDHSQEQIERKLARHVKPLLEHNGHHIDALFCKPCRLLAAWRAKP